MDSVRFLIVIPVTIVKILGIPTVVSALQDIAGADAQALLAVAKIEVAADTGVEVKALRVSCTVANAEVEEGRCVAAYQVVNLGPEMGKDGDYAGFVIIPIFNTDAGAQIDVGIKLTTMGGDEADAVFVRAERLGVFNETAIAGSCLPTIGFFRLSEAFTLRGNRLRLLGKKREVSH